MAILNVNPTRMELSNLKKRYKTATRGHKLLKDKRDEMMRQFVAFVKENKKLRENVEKELTKAMKEFLMARAGLSQESLESAVLMPGRQVSLKVSKQNVMSVDVPVFDLQISEGNIYPYGLLETTAELDESVLMLSNAFTNMMALAQKEKACNMLADEIEKTRRRVNALEYVMIPDLEDTIKFIKMKLDENDRASRTRLMKVKDMMAQRQ
ncbi:MAG: V-type ATP synthase subunit D [Clostridia bacterium]|nr:V-type ATP synthase subunit D [Clostridia bacterium]